MKWNVILLVIMIVPSAFSALPHSPSSATSGEANPMLKENAGEVNYKTHLVISAENLSLLQENQLFVEGDSLVFENITFLKSLELEDVSATSLSPSSGGPPLIESGYDVFLAYVKQLDWFDFSCRVISSHDSGHTFTDEYTVEDFSSAVEVSASVQSFDGKLFYFTSAVLRSGDSQLKVRRADNVSLLPAATPTLLSENINGTRIETISAPGALLVFWREYSTIRVGRFDGTGWSEENLTPATAFATVKLDDEVYVYFTRGDGVIEVVRSPDSGRSWSTPQTVLNLSREVNQLSVVYGDGRLHMALNYRRAPLTVLYTRSGDGITWEYPRSIAAYDMNYQDIYDDLSIAIFNENVTVAYENSSGRICLLNSTDSGDTWEEPTFLGDTHAHSPTLHPTGRYLLYLEGERLTLCLMNRYQYTATLRTRKIYIPAINSVEDLALYSGDFSGTAAFRIIQDAAQIYPSEGWANLTPCEGFVEVHRYTHIHTLSMNPGVPLKGFQIEMNLTRTSKWTPHITTIIINYSTSFPFTEEFEDSLYIIEGYNISVASGMVRLLPHSEEGYIVTGPFIPDGTWPSNLIVSCGGMVRGDAIEITLLDNFYTPIIGFSENYPDSTITANGMSLVTWGGKYLDQLPPSEAVYLRVDFLRGEGNPSLNNLTIAFSASPRVLSLHAERLVINRTDSVIITANIYDPDDIVSNMSVEFGYMDPMGVAGSDYFSAIYFSAGEWRAIFTPPAGSPTGEYVLGVNVTDPHGSFSGMIYTLHVRVLNNWPTKPGISLLPSRPKGGDSVSVNVVEPSTDVETNETDLVYNYRFYLNGTLYEEHLNLSERSYTLPTGVIKKHQVWRIEVTAFDGENESDPAEISFTVENSPPISIMASPLIVLDEDSGVKVIPLDDIFMDWDGDHLIYSFSAAEGILVDIDSDNLYIEPEKNFYGKGTILLRASDGENTTEIAITVAVNPVNDPPEWTPLQNITVMQDEWVSVIINSWDVDGEGVKVSTNLDTLIEGLQEGVNYLSYPNGSFKLKPDNSMVGTYTVVVTFSDSKTTLQDSFTLTVLNRDDPPVPPTIRCSLSEKYVVKGQQFTLYGESSDPDEIWGQELRFTWYSSLEGPLGSGKMLNVTLNKIGHHTINLTVSDGNHSVTSRFDLWVIREPEKSPVGNRLLLLVSVGAVSLAVGVAIAFLVYRIVMGGGGGKAGVTSAPEGKGRPSEGKSGPQEEPSSVKSGKIN